ncbi:MAG: hypothetical protein PHE50_05680 [Dehalococcoidales bacterium]|nr:hypothetical protein [Dehalococcoidales bacterium]
MFTLIVLIGVFLLLIIGTLLLAAVVLGQVKTGVKAEAANETAPLKFKLKYMALPLMTLLLTVILVVWFAPKLPLQAGYNFDAAGNPAAFMARGRLLVWTLLPQILLAFLAFSITWGAARLGNVFRSAQAGSFSMNSLLNVMGNIVGLPQLIIAYAMANIFSVNAYNVSLPPLWIFTLVVMGIAGVVLGIFFMGMIRKYGGSLSSLKDNSTEVHK